MAGNHTAKADRLHTLLEAFSAQLPDRLAGIRRIWKEVQERPEDELQCKEFYHQVHNLAGSAGTFGYHQIGLCARRLEQFLLQQNEAAYCDAGNSETIDSALTQLEMLAIKGADKAREEMPATDVQRAHDRPLVYVLEDDLLLAQEIARQMEHFGYEAAAWPTAEEIIRAQERRPADVFILDIDLTEGPLEGPRIAPQLQALGKQNVPLIFISVRDDWEARLATIQAGGCAYFSKPLDFTSLIERLDQQVGRKKSEPYRVMIVDDSVLLASYYGSVLQNAGMSVDIVNDPSRLLDTMADFSPDIVIMDLHMPQCSGIEAAQVIRQHPAYQSLPIVYFSTESALEKQLNALRVCGDDFLQKPISDAHLVAAISFRAKRFRDLNTLMTSDSLTGLLNHISLKLALERELALTQRRGGSLTFAMLDIDYFKSVNDHHGHPVGDRVIKSLARLLTQRLRKSDIAGRYGGEEFAVIFPDTGLKAAYDLLDDLREIFSEITYTHQAGEFSVSFSAGITSAPPYLDMDSVIRSADNALYEAKRGGRNRVVLSNISAAAVNDGVKRFPGTSKSD
ncbi:MAG: diguanylate cyclase [Gammaproteobacteria bacterium]|nr:diguanylate cyclase [Gammaproteobacteria bacterium]